MSQKKLMLVVEDGSRSKAKAKGGRHARRRASSNERQERPSYPRSWRFWLANDEEKHVKAV